MGDLSVRTSVRPPSSLPVRPSARPPTPYPTFHNWLSSFQLVK